MAQTTSLVFNGGVIPSPSPAPTGSGKAKLLKIGEITVTEQEVQVTKKVICDPDSITTVAPFMEVLTSAKLAELVNGNNILVLDNGTNQYLMSDASVSVEDGTAVCTSVSFLGLSREDRAKVLYPCTRITDELTLQQVLEVGEPVETGFDFVKAYPEDTEAGTLIDKLIVEDTVQGPDDQPLLEVVQGDGKVAINEDSLRNNIDNIYNSIDGIIETINEMDVDSVPRAYLASTLNQSPGDSVTTRTTIDVFSVTAIEGDCFEFEQTTTIDDTPFGYVWIEPGTYLINASVALQWVGNPRGTFIAKVGSVMGETFDFSQEQEISRQSTKVVTIPNRMKLAFNVTYDAGTPVMGFWVRSVQVVKFAGGMSQTNIIHDDTLVGHGSVADPLGVDEVKVAQSTLAGNLAPAFYPTRTSENPYKAGETVVYDGKTYAFKVDHYGAWSSSDVEKNDFSASGRLKIVSNNEYLFAFVDNNNNLLFGVKEDGALSWSAGIPDKIQKALLSKVNVEDGKGLILKKFSDNVHFVSNEEYLFALVDASKNILFGVKVDGTVVPSFPEIKSIVKRLNDLERDFPSTKTVDFQNGYYNVGSNPKFGDATPVFTYSGSYRCASVNVRKGDLLEVTGSGAIGARAIVVCDMGGRIVAIANLNQVIQHSLLRFTQDCVVLLSFKASKYYGATLYHGTDSFSNGVEVITSAYENYAKSRKYFIEYANAFNFEYLMNYIGNNQNVHPKVLNIDNKFNGHKFWMAYTPYPNSDVRYENPCVAFSDDGFSWTNVKNDSPIFDEYIEHEQYSSDTHLVYNGSNNTLELWWRRVVQTEPVAEKIYRSISSDGFDWETPELMYSTNAGSDALSPAVMIIDGYYHMWIVNSGANYAVEHYKSNNPGPNNWQLVDSHVLEYSYESGNYYSWHIDVALINGVFVLLSMAKDRNRSNLGDLFIATSSDGENWSSTYPVIIGDRGSRWDNGIYRSTIIFNELINKYVIYYSALKTGLRGIGISMSDDLTNFIGTSMNNI